MSIFVITRTTTTHTKTGSGTTSTYNRLLYDLYFTNRHTAMIAVKNLIVQEQRSVTQVNKNVTVFVDTITKPKENLTVTVSGVFLITELTVGTMSIAGSYY